MKVLWTKSALASLRDIYIYYKEKASIVVANRIRDEVLTSSDQLEHHALSGQIEESLEVLKESHRYILRGQYKIIYKIKNGKVYITDVFDTRQNPEKIKTRNK
ncbi:MAG: type II toxin-antitoxin system RelE/ParE family toxin [Mariniphaga sp.]